MKSTIAIGEKVFSVEEGLIPVANLLFYEANPRIYSLIQASGLTQQQIEEKMCSLDHVKQLAQSIKKVGLVDPIIVRKSDMSVLEGNSRLAAYKILLRSSPHCFAKIKARVIVDDITDEEIDILLGQYHIVGRKDWDPYEQASFMSRQIDRGMTPSDLAESYGISTQKVNSYVNTYKFMQEHGETDPSRWSYWDEYLKASQIKIVRKEDGCRDDLDALVIKLVRKGDISSANQDMRKVNDICRTATNPRRSKIFNSFLDEEISFEDACAQVEAGKDSASVIDTCAKFRKFISSSDTRNHIDEMNDQDKAKCDFELKKVIRALQLLGY